MKAPFGNQKQQILRGKVLRKDVLFDEFGRPKRVKVALLCIEYNSLIEDYVEEIYHLETYDKNINKINSVVKEEWEISFYIEDKFGKNIILDVVNKGLINVEDKGLYFAGYITEPKIINGNTYVGLCVPESKYENNTYVNTTKYVSICFKKEMTYLKKGQIKEMLIGNISEKEYNGKTLYSAPGLFVI